MSNFVEKAIKKFGDTYDYSLVEYSTAKEKVKIICKKHGEFFQTPDKHLNSKFGCLKCSLIHKNKIPYEKSSGYNKLGKSKYTKELCLDNLINKFGNIFIYDFSKFENGLNGIITVYCNKHGYFDKSYKQLITKNCVHACNKCGKDYFKSLRTKSWENFINLAKDKHNNKYNYINSGYINRKSIIDIYCPDHGLFKKSAQKHLSGQGCINCTYNTLIADEIFKGGYNETFFILNPKDKDASAKLYYLTINEKLYKIGITTKSINDRIKNLKSKSKGYIKNIDIIFEYSNSLYNCYNLEQEILSEFSFLRSPRRWSTELFSDNILNYNQFNKFNFLMIQK